MQYVPRPHQKRMTRFIEDRQRCGLLAEMGLGKTVTTLTAIDNLMFDMFQVERVLILAPLRVALITWPDEIAKWDHTRRLTYSVIYGEDQRKEALETDAHIHLMSYSTLPWLVEYIKQHRGLPYEYDMVIYDESTYIKNKDSNRWLICNGLFYDVPRKVLLTGTPSPNGLHDLWGQIYHLDHGQSLGGSLGDFRRVYFLRTKHSYKPLKNAKTEITKQLAHLVMPMKAADYLTLAKFSQNKIKCVLPVKHRDTYNELEQDLFLALDQTTVTAFDAASLSMKLRQFVQGFLINDEKEVTDIHKVKIRALQDIVDQTDDNLFVAVQFKHDIEMIRRVFGDTDVRYVYSGTTTNEDMDSIRMWNKGSLRLLVAHPASLSHGVNLQTGGHTIVWYGQTWSLEHHDQFNARLHRQGQKHPVIAHYLIMDNTIDGLLFDVIKRKARTQDDLMKGLKEYQKLRRAI